MATDILLCTINATYQHCAFGLRYLYANLNELQPRSKILEFTLAQNTRDIAENILSQNPKVLGLGVYIWNAEKSLELVRILKAVAPSLRIILGGPEVSYETKAQEICELADVTLCGEAELRFPIYVQKLLAGEPLPGKVIPAETPALSSLSLPYSCYTDEDIRHRIIYVEASRGCAFKCEFCLSSLDTKVRPFPLNQFLEAMQMLLDRGVREFKFVDRTFNLNIEVSAAILRFFLQHIDLGLFLHFEMIPDRLPDALRSLIQQFPEGALQFEVGIQTWNQEVSERISRPQQIKRIQDNLTFLKTRTNVHLHTDLIVGLPGETLESFQEGFDTLAHLEPHEIQVGILKRLRGTPIIRHDQEWGMVYEKNPPYAILGTKTMDFVLIQQLVRFAKFWNSFANSGHFPNFMRVLKQIAASRADNSLFNEFFEFSHFLNQRHPQRYAIALVNLTESAWVYLTQEKQIDHSIARDALVNDYCGLVKREVPDFLMASDSTAAAKTSTLHRKRSRQELHRRPTQRGYPASGLTNPFTAETMKPV